jgi:8-oxo-dGTP pyrophosphatase MutT (NUDIX family)
MTERDTPEALLRDEPDAWPVVSSADLHRDAFVMALRADEVSSPDGEEEPFRRWVLEHPGAAVVLAVDDEDRVVCLRQYRHPARRTFVELPAGLLDQGGEDPLDVARRELREEVGLEAAEWTSLGAAWSSPGISEEKAYYYLARGLTEVGRGDFEPAHEEAAMQVFRAPATSLRDAVVDGRCQDAPTVIAVLLADARGLLGGG